MKGRRTNNCTPLVPAAYAQSYNRLKSELSSLGFICQGTIASRRLRCGKPSCSCHRDRNREHGPYHYWTRKVGGRTRSQHLRESEILMYESAIRNRQILETIVKKMEAASATALQAAKMKMR